MKFKTIHSLGSRCQNSEILKHYGYREFSGFFDFMNTHHISIINHILADDFNQLLDKKNNKALNCTQLTYDPETGQPLESSIRTSNSYYNADPDDIHMAIFPHHDLTQDTVYHHFVNCRVRFKKLKNFPTLFNYTYNTWENQVTVDDMDYMINALQIVHEMHDFKVCFIGIEQGETSSYKNVYTGNEYDIWKLTIQPNSFTGGLFNVESDNHNYINIINNYEIDNNRITKQQIDNYEFKL